MQDDLEGTQTASAFVTPIKIMRTKKAAPKATSTPGNPTQPSNGQLENKNAVNNDPKTMDDEDFGSNIIEV